MDDIDIVMINILGKDARTPFSKIAKTLDVSTDTIFRRYRNLLKKGILDKPTVILDSKICGYDGIIDFLIKLKPGAKRQKVQDQLAFLPGAYSIAKTFGDQDLYLSMFFQDFEHITEIVSKLRQIKEIMSFEPLLYVTKRWTIPITPQTDKDNVQAWQKFFSKLKVPYREKITQ